MDVFDIPLHRWLLGEQARLLGLISALNAKNRRKIENEKKMFQVRRKGRGRPKNPRTVSLDDQARLIQYEAELKVVDVVQDEAAMSAREAFKRRLLAIAKGRCPYSDRGRSNIYKKARDKKVQQLLGKLPLIRPPIRFIKPWNEQDVRDFLERLFAICKIKLANLQFGPRDTPGYRYELMGAEATIEVVERFLYSNHLGSRALFLRRAGIIAEEPNASFATEERKGAWKWAVNNLMEDLTSRYFEKLETVKPIPEQADDDDHNPTRSGGRKKQPVHAGTVWA